MANSNLSVIPKSELQVLNPWKGIVLSGAAIYYNLDDEVNIHVRDMDRAVRGTPSSAAGENRDESTGCTVRETMSKEGVVPVNNENLLTESLTLSPRLEYSGTILASGTTSGSWVQVILVPQPPKSLGLQMCATEPSFLVETEFCHVGQAVLQLLDL
ncbi:hypothetical protein AAY473_002665, partial [Plecturocebus cupreus]